MSELTLQLKLWIGISLLVAFLAGWVAGTLTSPSDVDKCVQAHLADNERLSRSIAYLRCMRYSRPD